MYRAGGSAEGTRAEASGAVRPVHDTTFPDSTVPAGLGTGGRREARSASWFYGLRAGQVSTVRDAALSSNVTIGNSVRRVTLFP